MNAPFWFTVGFGFGTIATFLIALFFIKKHKQMVAFLSKEYSQYRERYIDRTNKWLIELDNRRTLEKWVKNHRGFPERLIRQRTDVSEK